MQLEIDTAAHLLTVGAGSGHTRWVRISHWIVATSALTLAVTGFVILMAHPRLYWGAVGNDLTPALLELPISRNHRHGGWGKSVAFFPDAIADGVDMFDALHPQTILAYGMNGRDLPVPHGAPVRLRVETQLGYKSVKYLHRIVVKDEFDDMGKMGPLQNGWSWYAGI